MVLWRNRVLLMTHANITLYALCFWIQIGTLPYLTKKFDVNPVTFGNLQTTFAIVQLLGGPIFGRFGDVFGSRAALTLAFASAFCSYFLLGMANTVFVIFLSRLPSVFMHAMQGAQMVITDITDPNQRSDKLGKLGLSYGIGMVIGPMIGGLCTKYASEQAAAFVAAFGSLTSVVLVYTFIPTHTKVLPKENSGKDDKLTSDVKKSNAKLFDFNLFLTLIWKNPLAKYLLVLKTISGIPIGVLHSMFSMIALSHFQLSAEVNGYVLSYIGVVSMITQGLLVGRLTKLGYNDWTLINFSLMVLALSYLALALFVDGILSFCVALLPMVVSGAVFSLIVQTMLTNTVASTDTGSILGISMAAHSFIRSISPTIGGYIFQYYGFKSFGVLGAVVNGLLAIYLYLYQVR